MCFASVPQRNARWPDDRTVGITKHCPCRSFVSRRDLGIVLEEFVIGGACHFHTTADIRITHLLRLLAIRSLAAIPNHRIAAEPAEK